MFRLTSLIPSTNQISKLSVAALVLAVTASPLHGASPSSTITFTPMGILGRYAGLAVSNDGTVIGTTISDRAFRWTADGGMAELSYPRRGPAVHSTEARDISADGSTIVGRVWYAYGEREAFLWTETSGMVGLGSLLPEPDAYSSAYGVSADGSVVAGQGYSEFGWEAFRWTEAEGMVGLGDVPGDDFHSEATGISADGKVIIGSGSNRTTGATGAGHPESFRWTQETGIVQLGDLPGGSIASLAHGVSADGSVIVGLGSSSMGSEAFRWTEATGMVGLGVLPSRSSSTALDVSGDGSLVVGESAGAAFIWDATHGMRSLKDVVEGAGWDLTGWALVWPNGISDNGRYITGVGQNPASELEGWLIDLGTRPVPEPSSLILLGLGGLWVTSMRLRNKKRARG